MPMNVTRPSTLDVTRNNPNAIVYVEGDANTAGSWRFQKANGALCAQTFVVVAFPDQDLTENLVTFIEALGFTESNPYIASVLTDNRVDDTQPPGLNGDMTGRVIMFQGFFWTNTPDEWVEEGRFERSTFVDMARMRQMNVIQPDPNDALAFPPAPVEGITLGVVTNAFNQENLTITTSADVSGFVPVFLRGLFDGLLLVNAPDSLFRQIPYEDSSQFILTFYEKGDLQCSRGINYRCNTTGNQSGGFLSNLEFWDPLFPFIDLSEAVTSLAAEIAIGLDGDIAMASQPRTDSV